MSQKLNKRYTGCYHKGSFILKICQTRFWRAVCPDSTGGSYIMSLSSCGAGSK